MIYRLMKMDSYILQLAIRYRKSKSEKVRQIPDHPIATLNKLSMIRQIKND